METIAERLKSAYQTIEQSTLDAHRPANAVQLLAVSKTKPVSDIVQAYEVGQRLFAENYVQEGVEKVRSLAQYQDIEWHFIGPIQSNKSKLVAENFTWVHSVDRFKIAQRLNDQCGAHKKLNVCIQVNVDDEASKAGLVVSEVSHFAKQIVDLPNLCLRGLMAIPKANASIDQQSQSFATMANLFNELARHYPQIDTLSMGMSNDMALAIQHGSTMVRIGTAIFGSRG